LDISIERHLSILRSKLATWQNTYIDAKYDAEIAQDIGNDQLAEQAMARMKQALSAIAWIEKKLTEFET